MSKCIGQLDISTFNLPDWWHKEFGQQFQFVLVEIHEDQRAVYLLTELAPLSQVDNYYEIGCYDLDEDGDLNLFLEEFKGQLLLNKFKLTYNTENKQ